MNVSNTPWPSFSQADYDDEQWQRATILDHETGNTPKERYGLPVREPDGTLNRHGVHAAAARLAGAGAASMHPPTPSTRQRLRWSGSTGSSTRRRPSRSSSLPGRNCRTRACRFPLACASAERWHTEINRPVTLL